MITPAQKLAESLEVLKKLQNKYGTLVVRSEQLSRTHRERLLANGYLREVIKGWYIVSRPGEQNGDSTSWYASFWDFCAEYLEHRLGDEWVISPEQSLMLHVGNKTVPRQLFVRSPRGNNNVVQLPFGISVFDARAALPDTNDLTTLNCIRLYTLPATLIACSERFFKQNPTDVRTALYMINDTSELLVPLLDGGRSSVAGRLAGAFRNIGRHEMADEIINAMKAAGFDIREKNPFTGIFHPFELQRQISPNVYRISQMWQAMREVVLERFPGPPGLKIKLSDYLKTLDEAYLSDAYNSLSIEGYRVRDELIERVKSGSWDPENNPQDKENANALAARGYWLAFQSVKQSIGKIFSGQNPGSVVRGDHRIWYRELFTPSVTTGLLKPSDLAGYRNGNVFIRQSRHVPPGPEAVRDTLPGFFDLLEKETEPAVRAVLGHFFFVYIHPYSDGNGRIARFLMNVLLSSGGFPWTVIPLEKRDDYMAALEKASSENNITPFTEFVAAQVEKALR